MSHAAAIAHLREEVIGVARADAGRLVVADRPAFFGAVRGVICDLDYVRRFRPVGTAAAATRSPQEEDRSFHPRGDVRGDG